LFLLRFFFFLFVWCCESGRAIARADPAHLSVQVLCFLFDSRRLIYCQEYRFLLSLSLVALFVVLWCLLAAKSRGELKVRIRRIFPLESFCFLFLLARSHLLLAGGRLLCFFLRLSLSPPASRFSCFCCGSSSSLSCEIGGGIASVDPALFSFFR
jgi:hypothetical protein